MSLNPKIRVAGFAVPIAIVLMVAGARLWLVGHFANPTPYWDQWDAEADLLLRFVHGDLGIAALIAPHNEHRIVVSRVTVLALYALNGQWDPLLEMAFNAVLAGLASAMLWFALSRRLTIQGKMLVGVASAVVWMLPFGWENTLAGFQSGFFYVVLFSVLSIWGLHAETIGPRWCAGALAGVVSLFCVASGFLVGAAILTTTGWQFLARSEATTRARLARALCAGCLLMMGWVLRVVVPGHEGLRAHSVHEFGLALSRNLAWPVVDFPFAGVLIWIPAVALSLLLLRRNAAVMGRGSDLALTVAIWAFIQAVALAYGRGANGAAPASRYMDLLGVGWLCNSAALVRLLPLLRVHFRGMPIAFIAAAWFGTSVFGLTKISHEAWEKDLPAKRAQTFAQEANVQTFLATNDLKSLENKPWLEVPYPDPKRLAGMLRDKDLRRILPPELSDPLTLTSNGATCFVANGTWASVPRDPRLPSWGSFNGDGNAAQCDFRSETWRPKAPYWMLDVAGYLGAGELTLRFEGQGKSTEVMPARPAREAWTRILGPEPGWTVRLVATDRDRTRWQAFRGLREVRAGSYFVRRLDRIDAILMLGGVMLFVWYGIATIVWRAGSRQKIAYPWKDRTRGGSAVG